MARCADVFIQNLLASLGSHLMLFTGHGWIRWAWMLVNVTSAALPDARCAAALRSSGNRLDSLGVPFCFSSQPEIPCASESVSRERKDK